MTLEEQRELKSKLDIAVKQMCMFAEQLEKEGFNVEIVLHPLMADYIIFEEVGKPIPPEGMRALPVVFATKMQEVSL